MPAAVGEGCALALARLLPGSEALSVWLPHALGEGEALPQALGLGMAAVALGLARALGVASEAARSSRPRSSTPRRSIAGAVRGLLVKQRDIQCGYTQMKPRRGGEKAEQARQCVAMWLCSVSLHSVKHEQRAHGGKSNLAPLAAIIVEHS